MRAPLVLACVLASLVACQPSTSTGDGGEKTSPTTNDPAVKPPVEPAVEDAMPVPPACKHSLAALDELDRMRASEAAIDVGAVTKLVGADTLAWLREADVALGRMTENNPDDVALLEQVLAGLPARDAVGVRSDLALISTQLRGVAFLELRRLLGDVAEARLRGAEAIAAWDRASCLWEAGLRKLAARAEALPVHGGEGWEASIEEAFDEGRAAIAPAEAGDVASAIVVKASKQQIEKGLYVVAHRLILADAQAQTAADASEALGLIDALEDRLADRNGPGLQRIRRQLAGDPAKIDAAAIERDLAIAFSKRARKYCDKAVVGNELATPTAVAETWEGVIYTRLILPGMRAALSSKGFDADAHLEDWERYLDAVEAGDAALAAEISPRLIEWNCAYQAQLGIAECTSSGNELN
jgi:riboflavin biosynthesis pyrimidine reductase